MKLNVRRCALLIALAAMAQPLQAQEPKEPTTPEVVVQPPPMYRSNSSGRNGIPWDSGRIYSDSQLVGPYAQPVWTTQRPWATTRVYVLPPGTYQVEQWVRPTWKKGKNPEYRMLEEIAIGLPGRNQIDIYERWNIQPNAAGNQATNHEGVQIEWRHAFADWGDIFLNPTFYAEWVERGGPQDKSNKYELKLLLGEQFGNWFYGSNLILEQETRDERETELGWSNAISTTIIDRKLMAGIEMNYAYTSVAFARSKQEQSFTIGPSIQYRPTNRTFLDVVGLFGTTKDAPVAQMYIIFGYQWGTRAAPISGPASTRGN